MKFKSIIRGVKGAEYKKVFSFMDGTRMAIRDGYIALWGPDTEERCLDINDEPTDLPTQDHLERCHRLIQAHSPPLTEMVKVNSRFLGMAVSALEIKASAPVYLQVNEKYIAIAYEQDGVIHRAAVACMKHLEEDDGAEVE